MVPEDKIVLIKFTSLNIQNQVGCDHDYLSLQSNSGVLISTYVTLILTCHVRVSKQPEMCRET